MPVDGSNPRGLKHNFKKEDGGKHLSSVNMSEQGHGDILSTWCFNTEATKLGQKKEPESTELWQRGCKHECCAMKLKPARL